MISFSRTDSGARLLPNVYKHPIVHIQATPPTPPNNPGAVVFLSHHAVQDRITRRAVPPPSKLIQFVTVFIFLDLGMLEGYGAVIFRPSVMGRPKLGPFGTGTHRGLILRTSLVFQTTAKSQFSCVMWMLTICLILWLPGRHKPYMLRRQSHQGAVFPNTHLRGDPGNPHFIHAVFSKSPCNLLRLLMRRATELCKALYLWLKLWNSSPEGNPG